MQSEAVPKRTNLIQVFSLIRSQGAISRASLAARTGLSRAAIGLMAEELIQRGLVEEAGLGDSSGGRPPVLLRVRGGTHRILGAALYDRQWNIVSVDLRGEVLERHDYPLASESPEEAVDTLTGALRTLSASPAPAELIHAVGIGAPGLVDMNEGKILSAHDLGWNNLALAAAVRAGTGLTPYVANRSKVSALAEYWARGGEYKNMAAITVGTGVAAGFIIDGKLYRGANSSAGELGHVGISEHGPLCACGNRGCLQTLVGEDAILRRGQELAKRMDAPAPEDFAEVLALAGRGVSPFTVVLEEVASHLAVAVSLVVNLLNPELIVLGGPVVDSSPALLDAISQRLPFHTMPQPLKALVLEPSRIGVAAGSLGAATLVLESIEQYLF